MKYSRSAGGFSGLGYIPYSEIICYLNEEQILDVEDRGDYIKMIQLIDSIDIELQSKKQSKKKSPSSTKKHR